MAALDDLFGSIGLPGPGQIAQGFTGQLGAEAALEGARSQTALGREALGLNEETLQRLEQTLAPFVQAGLSVQDQASQLFGPQAGQAISQDPVFKQALERQQRQLINQQAARGRLGASETPLLLQSQGAQLGQDFLSRQRGDLLSALGLGQASAAQQASGGLQTGRRGSDLLTQIGNAQAAGGIGAAQSLGQGSSNVAGLAGSLFSLFSDRRLKRNTSKHGTFKGYNTYKYQYLNNDTWFIGVMSDEVKEKNPDAVDQIGGYDVVNYGAL
jgi:hypothetical protein